MSEALGTWVDGAAATTVPADDRGLQYGDGLSETILLRGATPRFFEAHLARLARGCSRLGIDFTAWEPLRAEVARIASQAPALAILKIIVTRGSGPRRGYAPHGTFEPRRVLMLFTAPTMPAVEEGVRLRVASLRLAENSALAGLKHLNRLENVLAASEPGHADHFESLLLDGRDQVVCGTMSNVFAARGGRLITPRLDRCGVEGVLRSIVLREAPRLGVPAEQGSLTLDELLAADEVFITNARIGVVRARSVGQHHFPMNDIVPRLAAHIEALDA
jgi:4-amino-4-deoxychorismate lyase